MRKVSEYLQFFLDARPPSERLESFLTRLMDEIEPGVEISPEQEIFLSSWIVEIAEKGNLEKSEKVEEVLEWIYNCN